MIYISYPVLLIAPLGQITLSCLGTIQF